MYNLSAFGLNFSVLAHHLLAVFSLVLDLSSLLYLVFSSQPKPLGFSLPVQIH